MTELIINQALETVENIPSARPGVSASSGEHGEHDAPTAVTQAGDRPGVLRWLAAWVAAADVGSRRSTGARWVRSVRLHGSSARVVAV